VLTLLFSVSTQEDRDEKTFPAETSARESTWMARGHVAAASESHFQKEDRPMQSERSNHGIAWNVAMLVCLLWVGAAAVGAQQLPLNAQLTVSAWDLFNKGEFERAIEIADKCLNEFRLSAEREQAALEKAKAPLPPTGSVPDNVRKAILARGVLNDVGTCWFIKGRSAENLGRREVARQAYEAAKKFTHARCWDPRGPFFWSPAEAAGDRLSLMK
jgi:tetratricopeptide (TPR) repeat protein